VDQVRRLQQVEECSEAPRRASRRRASLARRRLLLLRRQEAYLDRLHRHREEGHLARIQRLLNRRPEGCLDRRLLQHNRRPEDYLALHNHSRLEDSSEAPLLLSQPRQEDYSAQPRPRNPNRLVGYFRI
jgi:hypothetical protein